MKKGFLQISFAWLFAIVAGAFILFLAVYFAVKLMDIEQTTQSAETGKEIGILLNPLETSFETGKTFYLGFPVETRIYNKCSTQGVFGRQIIQVSQKNFNKWSETNIDVGFSNKYIFSQENTEGKTFYIFSKPFVFPFKISDLTYLTSSLEEYCFLNAPEDIQNEISLLNQKNLLTENCSSKAIKVCFDKKAGCQINVDYNNNYVLKEGEKMYFQEDALMYAAIFSEKDVYECQTKRLMKRANELALLYNDKEAFISERGCDSNLDLLTFSTLASNFDDSADFASISNSAEDIRDKNDEQNCKLW